jgi:hypothetical protein
VDLNYHIANRQLQASNIIVLDQFTFGEKVASTNATKLPVKLAIAILKDRDGKIRLDVPIEGSIDNPEFHLGKVIRHAIMNIIVKIATSPFSVLGALFGGGGEEMGYQVFAPASSVLVTNETVKLDNLIKGLYARPTLQVAIEGSVDLATDLDGLRRLKLDEQLRQLKWQTLRKAARANLKPEDVQVTADERADLLKDLYRKILKDQTAKPVATNAVAAAVTSTNRVAATKAGSAMRSVSTEKGSEALVRASDASLLAIARTTTVSAPGAKAPSANPEEVIEQAVLQTIAIGDAEFAALAAARAQTVKEYLLSTGKVEAERIFITEKEAGGTRADGARTVLQLQ